MMSEPSPSFPQVVPRKPVASAGYPKTEHRLLQSRGAEEQTLLSPSNPPRPQEMSSSEEHSSSGDVPVVNSSSAETATQTIRGWGLEIVATISSVSALVALLILLACHDGQPLATWAAPLSLNTMVSILTLAIRTPLAFVVGSCIAQGKWVWFVRRKGPLSTFIAMEEAGRGPLGSVTLLWELKLQHWVSFGAMITLALLVIDPFLQGVIVYQGEVSPQKDGTASAVRASRLAIGDWGAENSGLVVEYHNNTEAVGCYYMYPDLSMSVTTQIGFINTSTSRVAELAYLSCSTGNCTWPTYSTLGICSSCADISNHLSTYNGTALIGSTCVDSILRQGHKTYTTYELPYGRDGVLLVGSDTFADLPTACSRLELASSVWPNETYYFQHWDTLLASYAILYTANQYQTNESPSENAVIKATECALRYCIQTHKTTMQNGKIEQSVLSAPFERTKESWQPLWRQNGKDHPPILKEDLEADFGNSLARKNESECTLLKRSDLQLRLVGDSSLRSDVQRVFNLTQKSISTMISDMDIGMANSITKGLSNSKNITAAFENAARLMTNRMREIDGTSVEGTAQHWVIYIRVRWAFITAPVSVSLAGIIFALGVVRNSRRIRLRTLKSDPFNLLLHGLDDKARGQLRADNRTEGELCKVTVGLEEGVDGLELKLCANSHG